jgi:hypothetical protein
MRQTRQAPEARKAAVPAMSDLTSEGERLVEAWSGAKEALWRMKQGVVRAECDLQNSTNALSKWLLPEDAKPGEKICVWHGDRLIQVEVNPNGADPTITVRKQGKRPI